MQHPMLRKLHESESYSHGRAAVNMEKRMKKRKSVERELTGEGSKPTPKEVKVCVGVCGNVAFESVSPEDAYKECLTECLANCFTESGRYRIKCKSYKSGTPMDSDYGWECEPEVEKIDD